MLLGLSDRRSVAPYDKFEVWLACMSLLYHHIRLTVWSISWIPLKIGISVSGATWS